MDHVLKRFEVCMPKATVPRSDRQGGVGDASLIERKGFLTKKGIGFPSQDIEVSPGATFAQGKNGTVLGRETACRTVEMSHSIGGFA